MKQKKQKFVHPKFKLAKQKEFIIHPSSKCHTRGGLVKDLAYNQD